MRREKGDEEMRCRPRIFLDGDPGFAYDHTIHRWTSVSPGNSHSPPLEFETLSFEAGSPGPSTRIASVERIPEESKTRSPHRVEGPKTGTPGWTSAFRKTSRPWTRRDRVVSICDVVHPEGP